MQSCLMSQQTRWMDHLRQFDFDIQYIKGMLNKVADVLSRYFEHEYWTEVPELQDYVNADVHLDPEHDNLPWEHFFKVKEEVIESRVCKANSNKNEIEICALQERIQGRDILAAKITASQEPEKDTSKDDQLEEDPTVFNSRAKGKDLHETMAQMDSFENDIIMGYNVDPWFQMVKEKLGLQTTFKEINAFLWAQN